MSLVMYAGSSTHRITGTFNTGSTLHNIDTHTPKANQTSHWTWNFERALCGSLTIQSVWMLRGCIVFGRWTRVQFMPRTDVAYYWWIDDKHHRNVV